MADPRFFPTAGPFRLGQLAERSGSRLASAADGEREVRGVAPLDQAGAGEISFLDNPKYVAVFAASRAEFCVVGEKHAARAPAGMALLIAPSPYLAYARIAG
ncbi:MAG: UDP-3-O-(3-hydroxymyristoyl)glucosamine N-acyltransferase, partial [Alphaproteobacteria bacterium]|nr:UDP-3-O-(3-hydroxymyristoyl)glucosamine N-acyltransferase [Alphaproteobacteria bacterium]